MQNPSILTLSLPKILNLDIYISFKIGVLLAQARIGAGMTQEELARRLNLDQSTIISLENNAEDVGIWIL